MMVSLTAGISTILEKNHGIRFNLAPNPRDEPKFNTKIKVKSMPLKQGLIRTFAQNFINIIRRVRPV